MQNGIPEHIAMALLFYDIKIATENLEAIFPKFDSFYSSRRKALINMMYNLGRGRFIGFVKMIKAIRDGEWDAAARECLDSDAGRLLKSRYAKIAIMLRKGI